LGLKEQIFTDLEHFTRYCSAWFQFLKLDVWLNGP